jgi:ABC-2 type transport system permease protein
MLTILLPLQFGEGFLTTDFVLLITFIVPMGIMLVAMPDSFAGERERHTLEAVLASRLPDRAILFGKLIVPVVFAWAVLAIAHTLALVIFNVAHWDGSLRVHPPTLLLGIIGLGILLPLIGGGLGVIISLRATTVQAAAQTLVLVLFSPIIVLQIAGAVVIGTGRGRIQGFLDALETVNWTVVLVLLLAGLLIVTCLLLIAAMSRFQRARLILR